jgi:glutamate synthase (NADPH/NADH) large chain
VPQDFGIERRLDMKVIEAAREVLDGKKERVELEMKICNEDRTFGATLSNEISLRYRDAGLKDDSIKIRLSGHAGQSFGAFLGRNGAN